MTVSVGAGGAHKNVVGFKVGAGGTWKGVVGAWVGASGVWKRWFSGYSALMTPATDGATFVGFTLIMGSISNATVAPGVSVISLAELIGSGSLILTLSGFTSDPGYSYMASISINGSPFSTSLAAYSYSSGQATWIWGTGYGFTAGVPVVISIP